ncbi:hypothetical protein H2199_006190 [Coniosporium tulheliwenetii]|uniref:Uncharacterized protein n=1 Tax=Coniosporium tulheliwenetii TaxID=3383036 RepID=A0ACC2YXC4_9PEZI|nr:hypothetical protein H2199_006190 [Cladosporium sp. JES 115]
MPHPEDLERTVSHTISDPASDLRTTVSDEPPLERHYERFEDASAGEEETSEVSTEQAEDGHTKPSKRERIKRLGQRTKLKVKRAVGADDTREKIHEEYNDINDTVENDPAFNPQKIFGEQRTVASTVEKSLGALQKAAHVVAHPKEAVQHKAASKLATSEHPYLSQKADAVLLEAHEELSRAQSSAGGSSDDEERVEHMKEVVGDIEHHRESMKVAWTTSRFVHRVRIVTNTKFDYPRKSDYREYDENEQYVRFRWPEYIGHRLLYDAQNYTSHYIDEVDDLPFDRDILIKHTERLIMASSPWQSWFANLRKVYTWEDPLHTAKWLAVFTLLWISNCVVTFFWVYIIFIVVANRYQARSVDSLRASHERELDKSTSALKFGEIINRHGSGNWIDPALNEIGPWAQIQLSDLADFFEIIMNFYEWKDPRMTAATVFFFSCCIAIGLLTPTGWSMRIVTLIGIMTFFFSRPIATRYPKYRHIVSPFRYIFWDIPTHAEWSFRYLRKYAQETREKIINRKIEQQFQEEDGSHSQPIALQGRGTPKLIEVSLVDGSPCAADESDDSADYETADETFYVAEEVDFLSFRCRWHGQVGQLAIYSGGIRFIRSFPKKELWRRRYAELVELRKLSTSAKLKLGKTDKLLEFAFTDGTIDQVEAMRARDEAFNTIVGFSGLRWQVLQPLAGGGTSAGGEKDMSGKKDGTGNPQVSLRMALVRH